MTKVHNPAWLCLSILLSSVGCAGTDATFSEARVLLRAPVALDDGLVVVDVKGAVAHVLPLDDTGGKPAHAPLAAQPTVAVRRSGDHNQALILCDGRAGDRANEQEPGRLTVLESNGRTHSYLLGNNPFDALAQNLDGRFALLRRLESGDRLIKNVNEIAVVDMEAEPETPGALSFFTLQEPPRSVFFSDAFELQGKPRSIAVVLSENMITLVDLEHLGRTPTLVDLRTDTRRQVLPEQVLFDSDNGRIYVRGAGADDIFSLRLLPRTAADASLNDFSTSVDIIAAGRAPTDMQIFRANERTKLLVIAEGSRTAVVVDVDTSRTTSVSLPGHLDHAYVYQSKTADAAEALLWDVQGTDLYRINLSQIEQLLERGVEKLPSLPAQIALSIPLLDGRVVMIHQATGLTLVDPEARSVTPFASRMSLGEGLLDQEHGRLWIAPEGQNTVAYLNLEDGSTDELTLDDDVFFVVPAFSAGKVVVIHDDAIGYVTLVDVKKPGRKTSRSIRGFILEGILD